jgi:hypothetical protein
MCWAGFGSFGKTTICFITGNVNTEKYIDILTKCMMPSVEECWGEIAMHELRVQIRSIPARCLELLQIQGKSTSY